MDVPWGLLFVLALIFMSGYGDYADQAQKAVVRFRDQLHKERMAAIEKGLAPPDASFDEALFDYLESRDPRQSAAAAPMRAQGASGWAISLIAAGLGWYLASALTDPESPVVGWIHSTAPLGLLPVMLGSGLLLHAVLLRRALRS